MGPDAQHQFLVGLSGTWSVKQSLWLTAGQPPKLDTGTAEFSMVLNGRHLRQDLKIDDGTGFEGLGYLGYDTASGQFFSTWMDVNFPGLVVAYGGFDAPAKAYVLNGSMAGIPVRDVLTVTDTDHFRYAYYETRNGTEALTVQLDYSR